MIFKDYRAVNYIRAKKGLRMVRRLPDNWCGLSPVEQTRWAMDDHAYPKHELLVSDFAENLLYEAAALWGLSEQQERVMRFTISGATNKEIAARLDITFYTVNRHMDNVLAKSGIQTRARLAGYFLQRAGVV